MSFTITVAQAGTVGTRANGLTILPKVLNGAAVIQPGAVAGSQVTTASQAITPAGTGSWVYGAVLGTNTTLTAASGTTFSAQVTQNSLRYIALRSTSTMTAGSAVTLGASAATTGLDIALCEILAAAGAGGLGEDASGLAVSSISTAQAITSAALTPPAGSLIVLTVISNGSTGTTTVGVTDTSGLGLAWVEQSKQNGASKGYAGVWTAQVPGVKAGGMIPFWLP